MFHEVHKAHFKPLLSIWDIQIYRYGTIIKFEKTVILIFLLNKYLHQIKQLLIHWNCLACSPFYKIISFLRRKVAILKLSHEDCLGNIIIINGKNNSYLKFGRGESSSHLWPCLFLFCEYDYFLGFFLSDRLYFIICQQTFRFYSNFSPLVLMTYLELFSETKEKTEISHWFKTIKHLIFKNIFTNLQWCFVYTTTSTDWGFCLR